LAKKAKINNQKSDIYLRKVILENFLSFQKGEVDFGDSRFIVVTGPNWSGKTSIYSAIKFVLGSNERDERYTKWSSFIRHFQKHAMVELHIQNKEELIQLRRTVIGGKSPFFSIKKQGDSDFHRIHANEVQNLVSDLNINPDNHFAFVSQGKIDAIKDLKPTTLCSFLEEGIGLKSLREEILQQKNDVLNLNSELNSLITKRNTINISLELLKPKLERLKEKKKFLLIRKTYEDERLWANRNKIQEEVIKLEHECAQILASIEEIKQKKEENDAELKKFQKVIAEIDQSINDLSEKLGENKYKKKELVKQVQAWQNDKIAMKQELDALTTKMEKRDKILKNFKSQKTSLNKELSIINKQKNQIEKNIDELLLEQKDLAEKIKRNKEFLDEYNQVVSEKQNKIKRIKENDEGIDKYNDQIKQLFQSFKDIEHKLEQNKWFLNDPSNNLLKQLDTERNKYSSQIYDIEQHLKAYEREKLKKIDKLKRLESSLSHRRIDLPTNITVLKNDIKKIPSLQRVKGPIIEYLKYDDKLSYAIESVLGENLLYSFIADSWESLNLLKTLKSKYKAYCNIYLSKNLKVNPYPVISAKGVIGYLVDLIKIVGNDIDVKKVIYSKIKNCLVVKDYRSGTDVYKNNNFKGKCVTLKGEQIVSYKYVFETPYSKRLKGLLSAGTQQEQAGILEAELRSINDEMTELKVEAAKLDKQQKEIYRKKDAFDDLMYAFRHRQSITSKKNRFLDERADLEELNSMIRNEIKELEVEIKKFERQKDPEFFKWNERINDIPSELSNLNESKKEWDEKLNKKQKLLKEIEENITEHANKLSIIKVEHKMKKEAFQKADKGAFNIYREIGEIDDAITEIKDNISQKKEERTNIIDEKSDLDKANIQIKLNLEQANVKKSSLKQEISQKRNDLERINAEIGEKPVKIRPLEEIQADITETDKLLLKYLDVTDSLLVERDQMMHSLKQIAKNQKDIKNDIKAAMNTENKMENTYYDKFKVVLDDLQSKINLKFESSKVKQYCSLDLVGDFDNLGVEIKAATSKDLVKECTALSGGQVSMVSICLMLSLQEIKPTPLCMFDEAGMFLDDKNSEIVFQLIKSTLEERPIQMMVFLPKFPTSLFELADKLIGVARTGKSESSHVFYKPKIKKVDV